MDEVDDFLAHYGVKGMRWGKRKGHTESRKQYKNRLRSERQTFEQQKLDNVLKTSIKKGEDVLVSTRLPGDTVKTIMTGKQFVEHASRGGLMDGRATDVFASLDPKLKQFVLNPDAGQQYVPSERI